MEMPLSITIIFWILIGAFLLLFILSYCLMLKRKKNRFKNRPLMSEDQIYESFYSNSNIPREIVIRILKEVSLATDIPVGLLRPEDRLGKELAPVKGWEYGDGIVELAWNINSMKKKLEKRGYKTDTKKIETVDNYVHEMAKLILALTEYDRKK